MEEAERGAEVVLFREVPLVREGCDFWAWARVYAPMLGLVLEVIEEALGESSAQREEARP